MHTDQVMENVVGRNRRQYAMALYLMDQAVARVHDAIVAAGQHDNTYIIFA